MTRSTQHAVTTRTSHIMQDQITREQAEALVEINRKGGVDEVEIVDSEAVDQAREALGSALQIKHGLPDAAIGKMSLETLSVPFSTESEAADAEGLTETLATSPQHPETGGTDGSEAAVEAGAADDDDEGNVVEALADDDRDRVEEASLPTSDTFSSLVYRLQYIQFIYILSIFVTNVCIKCIKIRINCFWAPTMLMSTYSVPTKVLNFFTWKILMNSPERREIFPSKVGSKSFWAFNWSTRPELIDPNFADSTLSYLVMPRKR